ncbi:hypothetical protein HON36_05195 [Candidatus Parcubacteria bacterium]|jgi:hypothetical protein|nr:hypothetical protein [Candidatus Parcubacteria bacterium]MBT7228173.1 hypothetical protein [Candidatus Parcubacteria bacterium]
MLIKNLELSFDRQEGDKVILKTGSGAEVALAEFLLDEYKDKGKKLYLSLDEKIIMSSDSSQKEVLNELLDSSQKNE